MGKIYRGRRGLVVVGVISIAVTTVAIWWFSPSQQRKRQALDDKYAIVNGSRDGLSCIAVVKRSLVGYIDKASYQWNLSMLMD